MTDFDLCIDALQMIGIDFKIEAASTVLFKVIANTYKKPTEFYFYWCDGKEFKMKV